MSTTLDPRVRAFQSQRHDARRRGVSWEFSFEAWWACWEASGRWAHRGRGRGKYMMARHGDMGPYALHNVEIITHEQNSRDSRRNHPLSYTRASVTVLGRGRGWTRVRGRYQVMVSNRYIGTYDSAEEARAAYHAHCDIARAELQKKLARAA